MNRNKSYRYTPLLVAIGVMIGIIIGNFYANHFSGKRLNIINSSSDKFNSILHIVDDQYVDSVNIANLVEESLPEILKKLDPHSVYIPASEAEKSMQDLKGSFVGIGIQFMIYDDTIRVVKVLEGGPSQSVGLEAGDRIVTINGKAAVGKNISSEDVQKKLKGPNGSVVRVGILRTNSKRLQNYSISRGAVPLKSVDAAFMTESNIGYIRISNFGEATYSEFLAALATLSNSKLESLIIDLRGNLGGYMSPAVQIANEFLPKGRLIVYTQGRKSPREDFTSNGRGAYQSLPLVVLVDESSASASEILAGAIQDNDRGLIIGRRSFGKGLVQIPIEFNDGSMLRLTKARYYTPSGRCVQKPYTPGDEKDYEQDLILRAEHGEYFNQDSIKTSGQAYHTLKGRVVYGGGGIIPDIFIARDTLGINSYFRSAYLSGLIQQYAYHYVDSHRKKLSQQKDLIHVKKILDKNDLVEQFASYANKRGLKRRNLMIKASCKLLREYIGSNIIDDVLGTEATAQFVNEFDPCVLRAIKVCKEGKTWPATNVKAKKGHK